MPEKPQIPVQEERSRQEFLHELGKRIYDLRKTAGITQQELAEQVGVSFQCISYAERGEREPKSVNLLKIAKALNVTTDYLLTGEHVSDDYIVINEKLKKTNQRRLLAVLRIIDELT